MTARNALSSLNYTYPSPICVVAPLTYLIIEPISPVLVNHPLTLNVTIPTLKIPIANFTITAEVGTTIEGTQEVTGSITAAVNFTFTQAGVYVVTVNATNGVSAASENITVVVEEGIHDIFGKYTVKHLVSDEPVAIAASHDQSKSVFTRG